MIRNREKAASKKSWVWPFVPMFSFGLLALGLFISLRIARNIVCTAIAGGKSEVGCAFALPTLVSSLPLMFVAVGCVLTAIRFLTRR